MFLIFQYLLLPTVTITSQDCIPHTNKYLDPMRGYFLNNFINLMTPKMQLTKEQRIFIAVEYEATKNCGQVRRAFIETFPERNSPDKKTVYREVRNLNEH